MSLHKMYREERHGIIIKEFYEYYYAGKLSDNKLEFHITEIYIAKGCRGESKKYYDMIKTELKELYPEIKFVVGFIYPKYEGSEISLLSLIKYGFKLHSSDSEKIILTLEV